jgi:transcriptional regulator with XRE-family HTH domain
VASLRIVGVTPGTELERALRHGPFSRALRAAIAERGLSLDRLRRKLAGAGVQVSPSTLSHWQRGKSLPTHDVSMTAVKTLELVLDLPEASLITLLRRSWEPTSYADTQLWTNVDSLSAMLEEIDTSSSDRLTRLSVHDWYDVDAYGRERTSWTRLVLRATADGVDRIVTVFRADAGGAPVPVVDEVRFCRLGQTKQDADSGFVATELLFDHPLATGETAIVEFRTRYAVQGPPARNFDRRFAHPVGQYVLQVSFDPPALPVRCYSFARDAVDAPDRDRRELFLGPSATVHLVASNVTHGICGIDIEWES